MNQRELTAAQARKMKRSNILRGTIILTIAGFITRFIGFFYRIFLSNTMGAELMGIYQLIFPVYGICFTIYATGIQTSISQMVAAELGRGNKKNVKKILSVGLLLSVSLAVLLSLLLYLKADLVASRFLLEKRSVDSLRILAAAFPFCGITACINGYYYGLKKAGVPAVTQLLEQVIRVIFVYILAIYAGNGDGRVTCELAVIGLVIGEIASCIYNSVSLCVTSPLEKLPTGVVNPYAKEDNRRQI
jgi:stage V sporulation protein B